MMQISENGIGLIMELEGFKTVSYQCSADIWTYGYGSTTTLGGSKVTQGMSITQRIAEKLMQRNIAFFAAQVNRLIRVDLTQNQFDALVSFTYNLGGGALEKSTLLAKLNKRNYAGAAKEFNKWIYEGDGKGVKRKSRGLINRRKAERELFENDIGYENENAAKQYQPNTNNTHLRIPLATIMPLPTIIQAGLEGSDKPNIMGGVQPSDMAIATTGVAGAGSIATIILDPQILTPSTISNILAFLQAVDWRVAIIVVIVVVCITLWIRGRNK